LTGRLQNIGMEDFRILDWRAAEYKTGELEYI
jgi:hypothetical protein